VLIPKTGIWGQKEDNPGPVTAKLSCFCRFTVRCTQGQNMAVRNYITQVQNKEVLSTQWGGGFHPNTFVVWV